MLPETRLPGLHIFADSMGLALVNLTQLLAVLSDIMHNDDHWTFQGYSRSPILVPIESPHATE